MKKLFFIVLSLIVVGFGVGYGSRLFRLFEFKSDEALGRGDDCAFCNQEILDSQKICENEWAIALLSYKPVSEGHVLILPKRHVERYEMLLEEELLQINQMIKKVHAVSQKRHDSFSYLLLQKNGREVGQTVPHVHFHYIPKKINERPHLIAWKFLITPIMSPMSREEVHKQAIAYQEDFNELHSSLGEVE